MIKDVWYNVLLNSHIDDFKNLCFVNKLTVDICNDKHFWSEKFAKDNLWLPESFIKNMVKVYKNISYYKIKSIKIIKDVDNASIQMIEHHLIPFRIFKHFPTEIVNQFLMNKDIEYNNQFYLVLEIDKVLNQFNISYQMLKKNHDKYSNESYNIITVKITYDELILYLVKLLYWDPHLALYVIGKNHIRH